MKTIAVVLSGSGVFDGSEIHESVLTLLALARSGAKYQCFAPDRPQREVVNHLSGEVMEGEQRNILVESARIARGEIQPLSALSMSEFDGVIWPGGFGVAKNFCDFAVAGSDCKVEEDVLRVAREFVAAGKPSGYLCISPVLLPQIVGEGVLGTIGTDLGVAEAYNQMGGKHCDCPVDEVVVDEAHKIVSSPAYMLAGDITEAAASVESLVAKVLSWCD
ncbi:isoprenoid biosynthesis glyoxalase ElbB [Ferrimonas gelatinilytica]|uniref:Glyoxalase n=1 Tax=Ferrimonas gelatinilytica TaxID=1255257 RepID=A0ABP9RVM8_9GAMM